VATAAASPAIAKSVEADWKAVITSIAVHP
jgi:hypothetical protein